MNELEIAPRVDEPAAATAGAAQVSLWQIGSTFLRIGVASFSLAALGEARKCLTERKRWFSDEEFMQGLGLAQLLPGAPTVNLSAYVGFRLRGFLGAVVATVSFLLPGFLLILVLSYLYFRFGEMRFVSGLFRGLGALVVGLVLNAILDLWKSSVKTTANFVMALAGFALVFWSKAGILKVFLIAGSASLAVVLLEHRFPALARWTGSWSGLIGKPNAASGSAVSELSRPDEGDDLDRGSASNRVSSSLHWRKPTLLAVWLAAILAIDLALLRLHPDLMRMSGSFLRIGALTFGSGYAMVPFIEDAVVTHFGWLTTQQFAVALALSLITPGPVTIIGAFVGYKVAGPLGAAAGMFNMYFPAWAATTVLAIPYARAGRAIHVRRVIGGIVAAFVGTLVVVLIRLSAGTVVDLASLALAAGAFGAQRIAKLDTVWVVLCGALISLAVFH